MERRFVMEVIPVCVSPSAVFFRLKVRENSDERSRHLLYLTLKRSYNTFHVIGWSAMATETSAPWVPCSRLSGKADLRF